MSLAGYGSFRQWMKRMRRTHTLISGVSVRKAKRVINRPTIDHAADSGYPEPL
jgi:hypothetical protein